MFTQKKNVFSIQCSSAVINQLAFVKWCFGSRDTLLWPLPLWSETKVMDRPLKQKKVALSGGSAVSSVLRIYLIDCVHVTTSNSHIQN